ncbi:MAG TPA: GIY-YIG nuclease family protein [Candidatus Paceibacterota bacterium]|nr:GIY-YIG nuclease family protein [Candidatus Paceibacterota bacterium]
MKAFLYILENTAKSHYVGITESEPEKRLIRHNKGDVFSTKYKRPWKLIYVEEFENMKEARLRERQIKSWHGGNAFRKFLVKAAGSSNGRT